MGVYKTVNGAYRYSLMPTYYVKGCSPLALPLGELSPQVTERELKPFLNDNLLGCCPLGMVIVCPLRPRYARPPLPKGEAICFPGYVSLSGARYARPPLPRGEARDARAVHRKVYRSAPFIGSANRTL